MPLVEISAFIRQLCSLVSPSQSLYLERHRRQASEGAIAFEAPKLAHRFLTRDRPFLLAQVCQRLEA